MLDPHHLGPHYLHLLVKKAYMYWNFGEHKENISIVLSSPHCQAASSWRWARRWTSARPRPIVRALPPPWNCSPPRPPPLPRSPRSPFSRICPSSRSWTWSRRTEMMTFVFAQGWMCAQNFDHKSVKKRPNEQYVNFDICDNQSRNFCYTILYLSM